MLSLCYNHTRLMPDSHATVHYTLELAASKFVAYANQGIFYYFPQQID